MHLPTHRNQDPPISSSDDRSTPSCPEQHTNFIHPYCCSSAMEAAAATSSPLLSLSGARRSPTFLRCSPASARPPPYRCSSYSHSAERQLVYLGSISSRALSLRCSAAAAGSTSTEGWLLEPAGLSAQSPSFSLCMDDMNAEYSSAQQ
jgi:hypothetical protein